MAVNRVVNASTLETLLDLTDDRITEDDVVAGVSFHLPSGEIGYGKLPSVDYALSQPLSIFGTSSMPLPNFASAIFNDSSSYENYKTPETSIASTDGKVQIIISKGVYLKPMEINLLVNNE